jgi:hypothetical protein
MKKILFLLISILTFNKIHAQKNVTLIINHKLGANNFAFNTTAQNDLMQNFQITRVDYYISGIKIIHDGGQITPVQDYILVKGSYSVSEPLGSMNVTNVEGIKFSIGVDSPANNEDPALKLGPLAFQTPSMHWGWGAGYRFVALEGKVGNNFDTEFQLHGLWNENYFQQTVMAPGVVNGDNITINLDADYTQALKGIDVASGPLLHGVNTADLDMLKNFRDHVFKPGSGSTGINDLSIDKNIRIYPNPGKREIHIDISNSSNNISQYRVMNMNGRIVESGNVSKNNTITFKNTVSGNYVLALYNKELLVFTQMLVIE